MDVLAEKQAKAAWAAVLFGFISLAGLFSGFEGVKDFAYARASGKWEQTSGVVLSPDRDGFRYAYYRDGASREGRRISFLTRGYIGSPPPKKPGSQVNVYVSPGDPNTALLIPGGSGRRFAIWIVICGFIVFIGLAGLTRAMLAFDFPEYGKLTLGDNHEANQTPELSTREEQEKNDFWQKAYSENDEQEHPNEWGEPITQSESYGHDDTVYERLTGRARVSENR